MKNYNIEPVERKVTVYTVGSIEFLSKQAAQEYLRGAEELLNRTYYDVLYKDTPSRGRYSGRELIGVPGVANDNEYHNIAWLAHVVNEELITEEIKMHSPEQDRYDTWKIADQKTFKSFREMASFFKEWKEFSFINNNHYNDQILIADVHGNTRMSFETIHELARHEQGE